MKAEINSKIIHESWQELKGRHQQEVKIWKRANFAKQSHNLQTIKETIKDIKKTATFVSPEVIETERNTNTAKLMADILNQLDVGDAKEERLGFNSFVSLVQLLPQFLTITLRLEYIANSAGSKMSGKIIFDRMQDGTPQSKTGNAIILGPKAPPPTV
jgi:acyl-CoA-binding protein